MALLTMALLTMALLTMALLTTALLTMALLTMSRRGRCLTWGLGGSGQLGLGEGSGGGWCSGVPREVAGLNAEVAPPLLTQPEP